MIQISMNASYNRCKNTKPFRIRIQIYHQLIHNLSGTTLFFFAFLTIFSLICRQQFIFFILFLASSSGPEQSQQSKKRQAPDILSKYSFKHSLEEKALAELEGDKRLKELDNKLDSYHNAGLLSSKNREGNNETAANIV